MKITVKRTANAPAEVLWNYLADFSNIHRFHPWLKGSHYVEGSQSCEVGSTRRCDFNNGDYFHEQISDLKEGSHYTIDVVESSMRIDDASATLGVNPIDSNTTEIYMSVSMNVRNRLMRPMMYLNFKYKVMPGVLKGLEELYTEEYKSKADLNLAQVEL